MSALVCSAMASIVRGGGSGSGSGAVLPMPALSKTTSVKQCAARVSANWGSRVSIVPP